MAVLEARELSLTLADGSRLLDRVSLRLDTDGLALVGASGSGKSLTARCLLGMPPAGATMTGELWLDDRELTGLNAGEWRALRGRRIGLLPQDPEAALHPSLKVGVQLGQVLRFRAGLRGTAVTERALALLEQVRLPQPAACLHRYPAELSGGMRQRVLLALVLAARPRILLADEPTTALDPTLQADILALLLELRQAFGMRLLLITHDLALAAQACDRVAVMREGRILEAGRTDDIIARPQQDYTRALLAAARGGRS